MAPKHTPGPWLAMRGVDATDQYAILGGDHFVARIDPRDNRDADARLIAAAPELYLLTKWFTSEGEDAAGEVLKEMGWDGKGLAQDFVKAYAKSAIADAGGWS